MQKLLKALIASVLCSSILLIVGCNTVKGVGKDVANGGREIQRAAS